MKVADFDFRRLVGQAGLAEADEDENTKQQAEHRTSEAKFGHVPVELSRYLIYPRAQGTPDLVDGLQAMIHFCVALGLRSIRTA